MLTVYLVDDEFYVRTSLKNTIPWEKNGFHIVGEANNGKTAYEQIPVLHPDLAVVDINMPGYNGLELISRLQMEYPNLKCRYLILTGYGEFQYAQKALQLGVSDYILKPIDYELFLRSLIEIHNEITEETERIHAVIHLQEENRQLLLDQYFNELINCSLISSQALYYHDKLPEAGQVLAYRCYTVCVVRPFSEPGNPSEIRRLLSYVKASVSFTVCQDYQKKIYLICDGDAGKLYDLLFCILAILRENGLNSAIGIGKTYNSFEQLYLSYHEGCLALKTNAPGDFLFYSEMESPGYNGLEMKQKLLVKTHILEHDIQKLTQFYLDFYHSLQLSRIPFHTCVLYTMEFIYLLTELLSSQSSRPVCVLPANENILDILNKIQDLPALCQWLTGISENALHAVCSGDEKTSDITKRIEDYILEEYGNPDFSIPVLAEHLYLNYSYLCYCFKRDKGITINDYLNKIRIEKALLLMAEGIDNISYIAEKTGFHHAGYFSKKFKKATGLTPSEYRRTL